MVDPSPRTWPAIDLDAKPSIALPADFDDRLALAFDDAAAVAVVSDGSTHWRVYFEDGAQRSAAASVLRNALGQWLDQIDVDVPDEGWAVKVQRDLGPVRAGRIVVAPPWDAPPAAHADAVLIVIEPSVGFGTGHHQSTRLCLQALQKIPLSGARAADVGTGSAVLAIAAARLGARSVLAIDNDPDAIGAARENVSRNGVGSVVRTEVADVGTCSHEPFEVVTANLTVHLLRRFARPLAALVAPGGWLVTSGFTADQVTLVLDAFPGFRVEVREDEDDWVSLTLRAPEARF